MLGNEYPPIICVELPDGGELQLSDPADPTRPGGISRLGPAGQMLWLTQLPLADDWFVAMVQDGDTLIAQSWKGFRHRLTIEDGHVVTIDFVK